MEVNCPQCGAPVEALTETRFHSCPFCASSFLIQAGVGCAQYFFAHDRDDRLAWSMLGHFLEENRVTDIPQQLDADYYPFPFWLCTLEGGAKRLIPAIGHELSEVSRVTLPAGDLQFLPKDTPFASPTVPLEAARKTLSGKTVAASSLVYIPLYVLTYGCAGGTFHAVVSPLDHKVYANTRPASITSRFPIKYSLMMGGFATVLAGEGLLIKHHLWRGGVFLVSLALFYAVYYPILKREL